MKSIIPLTKYGKLKGSIQTELDQPKPSLDNIIKLIDAYENNNNKLVEKLKRERIYEGKRISGAIKQFLNAHPILTKELIGSLTKRIQGALLSNKVDETHIKIHKGTAILLGCFILIVMGFLALT